MDTANIPDSFVAIISNQMVEIIGCGLEFSDSLLLGPKCPPSIANFQISLCPGDSIEIRGKYYNQASEFELMVSDGPCDSLLRYKIIELDTFIVQEEIMDACEGLSNGSITVTAFSNNGPTGIYWSHNSSSDFSIKDLASGTYEYMINDGFCQIEREIDLGEYLIPNVELYTNDPLCPGSENGIITVGLTIPELSWSIDSVNFSRDSFINVAPGTYTVYFTNGNCHFTETVEVEAKLIEPFSIQSVIEVPVNTSLQLIHNYLDSSNHDFAWSSIEYLDCVDCISPIYLGAEDDVELYVVVTDAEGCEQRALVLLEADKSQHIFIPNAFSPNSDEINDRFKPFVRQGLVKTERLEIFDRWGNLVYAESSNPGYDDIEGWDGKINGKTCTPDLFVYQAEFSYSNGETKQIVGEVHLVR